MDQLCTKNIMSVDAWHIGARKTHTCKNEVARIVAAELRHDVDGDLGAVAFEESIDVTAGKSFVTSIGCNAHALAQPVTHNALKVRERESP